MIKLIFIALCSLILFQLYGQASHTPGSPYQKQSHLDSVSIITANSYANLKHQYDSISLNYSLLTSALQNKVDSLTKINVPANKTVKNIDSLNQIKDEKLSIIKEKVEEIKASTIGKIQQLNLPPEFQEKTKEYTALIDKLDITFPSSQFQVPDLQLPTDLNLSSLDIGNVVGEGLPDIPGMNIEGAGGINKSASQVLKVADDIPKDINPEGIAKAAETNVGKISEIDAVKDQLGDIPVNPLSSEEEAREELIKQAKEATVDHFAGKEQELKSAMDEITKYKKKFSNINNLEELAKLVKRKPNEMKGKPLLERLVPAITFQIQKKDDELFVDFNPSLAYRFTGKLNAGLGWNQRVPYNLNTNTFQSNGRIYGPRTFVEYKLLKGFSPRIEGEVMNTFVPAYIRTSPVDLGESEWVWGVFAGIKKDYKFFKKINGTALVMFRLFDPHRKSPYADVLNARFGFEFPMKKKVKRNHE